MENGPAMARRHSWRWSVPGIVLVALLAAFFIRQTKPQRMATSKS
jgi:hypothetical protein